MWIRVNLGSKFGQIRWEDRLAHFETIEHTNYNLFIVPSDKLKSEVRKSLDSNLPDKKISKFLYLNINKWIISKPSVSRQMIYLSIIFFLFYLVLLILLISNCIS